MAEMSFREQNRRRREQNAFKNLYAYAKDRGIPDPKRTAERAARTIHADSTNGSRRRTGGARSAVDASADASDTENARKTPHRLDERTKDELYERAQELDIEGRSKMTKDELIDAIRAQQ